ncbi:MAG: helicase-related protein [Acidimicrobiales bacterium]
MGRADEVGLFQSEFRVRIEGAAEGAFLPYPDVGASAADPEELSNALLYRDAQTYAVGHGCAAEWSEDTGALGSGELVAQCLPSFEAPSISPDVLLEDGTRLEVPMRPLAGLDPNDDGMPALVTVVAEYERWIERQRVKVASLPEELRETASRHLDACDDAAGRMRSGLEYLRDDAHAAQAFQLANRAMLIQQERGELKLRDAHFDAKTKRLTFSPPLVDVTDDQLSPTRSWRAFQIAFFLMSLRSAADEPGLERSGVELIWFPTGGGKTEAYLALAAFHMLLRRLDGSDDQPAVDVLMRYTLRLLTSQQFQRASGLILALESLRNEYAELGPREFSIGLWVGGASSPNRRQEAVAALNQLNGGEAGASNRFVLLRCPWCRAQMGPLRSAAGRRIRGAPAVIGYVRSGDTVVFRCPDMQCRFSSGLPIYVIDEDLYERRPSFVIGTVDKFANLAWRPEARALFGIAPSGERDVRPPGLIVQDELHLIAGPLGSMVGLYEPLLEYLCTDHRGKKPVPPKIVSSTATIRRYREQILGLYGRSDVTLFPPPGLDAGDSFFASYARTVDGDLASGRLYLGVHAPGLGSLQTAQVRTFSAAMQGVLDLEPEGRDPWWTLLVFFNSLRELGGALSLFQSDIPDYLHVLRRRYGLDAQHSRWVRATEELTGRLRDDEIPEKLETLGVKYPGEGERDAIDVCLASSILEVGIDIDRLSLMAIVGQPKTTAQYIQVSGRIGRRWWERPGLVLSLYSASKPRDRSHFERFRSYHQRLYAQVEPTSVTPFSPPALDRAIRAVITGYLRQTGNVGHDAPYPFPSDAIDEVGVLLRNRAVALGLDERELAEFDQRFKRSARELRDWERQRWTGGYQTADIPMLRRAGEYAPPESRRISWELPTSMRNVDAECQGSITTLYLA